MQHGSEPTKKIDRRRIIEQKILAAIIADRKCFDRIDSHLGSEDISPEGAMVLKAIRQFYLRDTKAQTADLGIIRSRVFRGLTNPKHRELFEIYFQQIQEADVSGVNVVEEVISAKRDATELALAEAILAKDRGRTAPLLERLVSMRLDENLEGAVHEEYQGLSADSLLESFDQTQLIRVAPHSLNRRLKGGVLRGHHIVVVAYPETGKTMLVLTMMAGFVMQHLKVLYIGNEDPIKAVLLRFVSCLTQMTAEQIADDPEYATEVARRRGYDNAIFAGLSGGTLEDVRALVTKHKPDVLIVDQIRNLAVKSENRTQLLETVARGMRNIAREYGLVSISVTQGADSSRNKLHLDMGDVDGSNVGIPGTADVMVMVGMNADYDLNNRRMLTLAKNKVGGDHSYWPVAIRREMSCFSDYSEERKK